MLASTYERSSQPHLCKEILSRGLDSSSNIVWWHSKFLFHLAHINATERNHATAANLLSAGADFAQMSGATYTQILFLLSKGMVLMIDQRLKEALPVLSLAQQLLEAWQGNSVQKESLTVFFLILQVCFHLNAGKVQSEKYPGPVNNQLFLSVPRQKVPKHHSRFCNKLSKTLRIMSHL